MSARQLAAQWSRVTLKVAVSAALIPTVLAAEGMVALAHDILRFPLWFAAAVAAFLELALIACALLARDAIVQDRPAQIPLLLTWIFSALSGLLSAAHQLIPNSGGVDLSPAAWLGATVRIAPPLVAASIWHMILVGDQHAATSQRPRQARRRDALLRQVALAAVAARRHPSDSCRHRLEAAYRRLLSAVPATDPGLQDELMTWLEVAGAVDGLPLRTVPVSQSAALAPVLEIDAEADLDQPGAAETVGELPAAGVSLPAEDPVLPVVEGPLPEGEQEGLMGANDMPRERWRERVMAVVVPALRQDRSVTLARLVEVCRVSGIQISERSMQRWRQEAFALLDSEPEQLPWAS